MQLVTILIAAWIVAGAGWLVRGWMMKDVDADVIEKFATDRVAYREFEQQQAWKAFMSQEKETDDL